MATRQSRKANDNPYRSTTSPDDLSPANRLAFEIVADRRDVIPSVERIMNAGLDEDATARALELFRDALVSVGDPHRDPRVAIERCS